VGFSGGVFTVGAGGHSLPDEKRSEAFGASDKCGPRLRKAKESKKTLNFLISKALIVAVVIPAIDHRCAWSAVPLYGVAAGDVLVALGFLIVLFVFKENTFASAIIEIGTGQKVMSSGPYALVRHPMYLGWLVTFLGVPLALGSWWGLFTIIPITLVIVWRPLDEETFLARNLPGYAEYRNRVRYRLIPFIW
jgi:protein-S-isoprenylcysteine O-methyltransferase Ste14